MTNRDWIELLSKEFNVSYKTARNMLHQIMIIKRHDNLRRDIIEKLDTN